MREIVLDTETTGFDPKEGHRVVEIGCLELIDRLPTGRTYHVYLNPERSMPEAAFKVHGLSTEFLQDKPLFQDVMKDFLAFVAEDPLVIHNAPFDMRFLNAELSLFDKPAIPFERAIDTLIMARKMFPGSPASLDALCRRYNINNAHREKHGALLDSELLAEVYLELTGGRQRTFEIDSPDDCKSPQIKVRQEDSRPKPPTKTYPVRIFEISEEEKAAHSSFLKKIKDPCWLRSA